MSSPLLGWLQVQKHPETSHSTLGVVSILCITEISNVVCLIYFSHRLYTVYDFSIHAHWKVTDFLKAS